MEISCSISFDPASILAMSQLVDKLTVDPEVLNDPAKLAMALPPGLMTDSQGRKWCIESVKRND